MSDKMPDRIISHDEGLREAVRNALPHEVRPVFDQLFAQQHSATGVRVVLNIVNGPVELEYAMDAMKAHWAPPGPGQSLAIVEQAKANESKPCSTEPPMTSPTKEDRETARKIADKYFADFNPWHKSCGDAIALALTAAREESASRLLMHPPKGHVMLDTGEVRKVLDFTTLGDGSARIILAARDEKP